MSTLNNIFSTVTDLDNLLASYRVVLRGKRGSSTATEIDYNLMSTMLELQHDLNTETYRPLPYYSQYIYEPKRRYIQAPAFRDRIVHHAIHDVVMPFYDRHFIKDSYACRVGKGTHQAMHTVQRMLHTYKHETLYACKIDISKYFASINHDKLKLLLAEKIRDQRLLWLLGTIIDSTDSGTEHDYLFPLDSPYHTKGRRGIPIGNLTSQLFANVYLHHVDKYAKHRLKIRLYVRYMDDILFFHTDKDQLRAWQDAMTTFLRNELYLTINPHKVRLYPTRVGVDFVGYVIYPDHIRLRGSSVRRFKKRYRRQLRAVKNGRLPIEKMRESFTAWSAHAMHANATGLIQQLESWQDEYLKPEKPVQLSLFDDEPPQ